MNLTELAKWFYRQGGRASFEVMQDDGLQPYDLARRGWIQGEKVGGGRWAVRYTPDGELLDAYLRLKRDLALEMEFQSMPGL